MTIALILSDLWRGRLLKLPPPGPGTSKSPGGIGLIVFYRYMLRTFLDTLVSFIKSVAMACKFKSILKLFLYLMFSVGTLVLGVI